MPHNTALCVMSNTTEKWYSTAVAVEHGGDRRSNSRSNTPTLNDSDLIQFATEIKVRAERRCGELLARTAETGERATAAGNVNQHNRVSNDTTPTLADMGLTRDESSRYQQLAAMPAEHFETAVATAKATAGENEKAARRRPSVDVDDQGTMPRPRGCTQRPRPRCTVRRRRSAT